MNFKSLLTVCLITYFISIHAQEKKNKLSFHFRETWAREYDINVEIYKSDNTEDYEVKKVVNIKNHINFTISKRQYDSLVTEIKKYKIQTISPRFSLY